LRERLAQVGMNEPVLGAGLVVVVVVVVNH
jgi:hypothetical protein